MFDSCLFTWASLAWAGVSHTGQLAPSCSSTHCLQVKVQVYNVNTVCSAKSVLVMGGFFNSVCWSVSSKYPPTTDDLLQADPWHTLHASSMKLCSTGHPGNPQVNLPQLYIYIYIYINNKLVLYMHTIT